MKRIGFLLVGLLAPWLLAAAATGEEAPLFDGKSLSGWEGNRDVFRVVDGSLVGGSLDAPLTRSEYLCTTREFADFELRLQVRLKGLQNAGVNFRSHRVPGSNEVAGYQADIGYIGGDAVRTLSDRKDVEPDVPYPFWGSLLDQFREDPTRYPEPDIPVWLLAVADRESVEEVLRPDDWNELIIAADGRRIEIALNGVTTVEFVEEGDVPSSGLICLQVHRGEPSEAWYRDIEVRESTGGPELEEVQAANEAVVRAHNELDAALYCGVLHPDFVGFGKASVAASDLAGMERSGVCDLVARVFSSYEYFRMIPADTDYRITDGTAVVWGS